MPGVTILVVMGGFGELVRSYRVAAGLTQEELAFRSGLGMRTISDIERGRTARPRRSSLDLLCRALDLDDRARQDLGAAFRPSQTGADRHAAGLRFRPYRAAGGGRRGESVTEPPAVPRQLPITARHVVGRADELNSLDDLLDRAGRDYGAAGIRVISGTVGVGKTTLALRWAHRAAEAFPDGQIYVDLCGFGPSEPMAPARAVQDLLTALHVPPKRIPASQEARVGLYRSLVSGKRMLIILDNARATAQVRPLLPGSSACAVIVTSRNQLTSLVAGEDARPVTLDLFSDSEAHELLARRLGSERVGGDPGTVSELISLCGGLPLALAIVAARASVGPAHMLHTLTAELRDARRRLDALDAGDAATSARTMISWSYQSLAEPAARMFRLLSMHPGPTISAPAAARLARLPLEQARRNLKELTQANLLTERTPGQFTLHDLLRSYAAEQATGDDTRPAAPLLLDQS
jgi:transcriptional regulator with XRE-family HTH domain